MKIIINFINKQLEIIERKEHLIDLNVYNTRHRYVCQRVIVHMFEYDNYVSEAVDVSNTASLRKTFAEDGKCDSQGCGCHKIPLSTENRRIGRYIHE